MKRLFCLILAIGSLFVLIACGKTEPKTAMEVGAIPEKEETAAAEKTLTEDTVEATETEEAVQPTEMQPEKPPSTAGAQPSTTTQAPITTTQAPTTTTTLPPTTTRPPVTTTTPPVTTTSNDIEPDPALLTFTKADIGKWVGRVSGFDLYVIDVQEGVGGFGLKHIDVVVKNTYGGWIPPGFSLWECIYCRQFPCPHGGDEKCPKYDIKLDSRYTCLHCFKPHGYGLEYCVRWMADVNCPRCGNFVKSHTCHNCPS